MDTLSGAGADSPPLALLYYLKRTLSRGTSAALLLPITVAVVPAVAFFFANPMVLPSAAVFLSLILAAQHLRSMTSAFSLERQRLS